MIVPMPFVTLGIAFSWVRVLFVWDVGVMAAVHGKFSEVTLAADSKSRNNPVIGFLLTFWALTKVFALSWVEVRRKIFKHI